MVVCVQNHGGGVKKSKHVASDKSIAREREESQIRRKEEQTVVKGGGMRQTEDWESKGLIDPSIEGHKAINQSEQD